MEKEHLFDDSETTEQFDNDSLQFAENEDIAQEDIDPSENTSAYFEFKRSQLKKTRISKQTWSILEIFQKIRENKLLLETDYQRNYVWQNEKKAAFIESLFMGIIIPPIYVVEIPGADILEENKYEVVDGKQRLSTLKTFIENELKLSTKSLEYFQDWFGGLTFNEIKEIQPERTTEMLSSVLDIYVITANSPEFTKYDIFSRLNKGSAPLKVNEIRRAVYRSRTLDQIDSFVNENIENQKYKNIFTKNDIKRYEDYGRFFRSIAYYKKLDLDSKIISDYKSRPRDMINDVLSGLQNKEIDIDFETLDLILINTLELSNRLHQQVQKQYYIDLCIYFAVNNPKKLEEKIDQILSDKKINDTFLRSPSTTSNVNKRFARIIEIMDS